MSEALLLCGDFGSTHCGVGMSEAAWVSSAPVEFEVVDPRRFLRTVREVLRARRKGVPVIAAWPTVSTTRSPRAFISFAAASAVAGRRLRWHLHEYAIFDEIRRVMDLLLWVGAQTVVVSRRSENELLANALGGRIGRRCRIEVVPPANGSAPTRHHDGELAPGEPVVGVFGTARSDKGFDTIVEVLRALPDRYSVFETVGRGWAAVDLPSDVLARYEVRHNGQVPDEAISDVVRSWTLAVAPFAKGADDGRMSLRTPLALGVPTFTSVSEPGDLTFRPPHLLTGDPVEAGAVALDTDRAGRASGARAVRSFEAKVRETLTDVLVRGQSPSTSQ